MPGLNCVAAQVLRIAVSARCPPLRRDVRELRRQAAVVRAGHAGTSDDADNPLRAVYGNEGAPDDDRPIRARFGTIVVDGFGSTEGGVAIGRTPDSPRGSLGPLPDGTEIIDVETGDRARPE